MKFRIILLFLISSLISCAESPKFAFEKNGVSFTSPSGWSIIGEENFEDEGYYLSIEKDGFDSSGIMTISWINDLLDLDEYIKIHIDELKSNIIYKNSNLIFEPILDNEFNRINTRSSSYEFKLLGLKHKGIIHSFYGKNRTYLILKQEALEYTFKNKQGFNIMEESFMIEQ